MAEHPSIVFAGTTDGGSVLDLPECGLVIEAVPEDLALKRKVFADLGASQPATTILATNTSSIDIAAIADAVIHPERVVGLHFFNPPPVMALVEVVHGVRTSGAVLDAAVDLMRAWGKTPVRAEYPASGFSSIPLWVERS